MIDKHTLGSGIGNYKFGPGLVNTNCGPGPVNTNWWQGPVNTNWGPGPVNTNLGPRPVNTNLGAELVKKLRTRAEGWGREPGLGQRTWGRGKKTPKKGFFFLVTVIRMSKRF